MKTLQLQFVTAANKTASLSVTDPKPALTDEDVKQAMNAVLATQVFIDADGPFTGIKGAQIIERNVTPFAVN